MPIDSSVCSVGGSSCSIIYYCVEISPVSE